MGRVYTRTSEVSRETVAGIVRLRRLFTLRGLDEAAPFCALSVFPKLTTRNTAMNIPMRSARPQEAEVITEGSAA